jgi:hypothetical protein
MPLDLGWRFKCAGSHTVGERCLWEVLSLKAVAPSIPVSSAITSSSFAASLLPVRQPFLPSLGSLYNTLYVLSTPYSFGKSQYLQDIKIYKSSYTVPCPLPPLNSPDMSNINGHDTSKTKRQGTGSKGFPLTTRTIGNFGPILVFFRSSLISPDCRSFHHVK